MCINICNTHFEWELGSSSTAVLEKSFHLHRNFLQLQFLPLFYAEPDDFVCVSHIPANYLDDLKKQGFIQLPKLITFSEVDSLKGKEIRSWGYSKMIGDFAKLHELTYDMPDFDAVKTIASRSFVFTHSERLPNSALFQDIESILKWAKKPFFPKVLKACFGLSGIAHCIIQAEHDENAIRQFAEKALQQGPILGEPWVNRTLDFSSQWHISKEGVISLHGITLLITNERGKYLKNGILPMQQIFGKKLPLLEKHKIAAHAIVQKCYQAGYFGYLGIDSFIYDQAKLFSIVEINPRMTFGLLALKMQKRFFPNKKIFISYLSNKERKKGLLPTEIHGLIFPKQLFLEVESSFD